MEEDFLSPPGDDPSRLQVQHAFLVTPIGIVQPEVLQQPLVHRATGHGAAVVAQRVLSLTTLCLQKDMALGKQVGTHHVIGLVRRLARRDDGRQHATQQQGDGQNPTKGHTQRQALL